MSDRVMKLPEIALASEVAATDKLLRTDGKAVTATQIADVGRRLVFDLPAGDARWVRVLTFGTYGMSCLMGIAFTEWSAGWGLPMQLAIRIGHGNSAPNWSVKSILPKALATTSGKLPFEKLRICGSEHVTNIDIYVPATTAARKMVVSVSNVVATSYTLTSTINPAETDTVKEYSIEELYASDLASAPSVTDAASFSFLGMVGGAVKMLSAANVLARKTARTDLNVLETGLYSVHLTEATPPFSSGVWLTLLVISMAVSPSPVALHVAVNSSKYGGLYIRSYSESASATTPFYLIQGTAQ